MRVFRQVVESGSFTAAAAALEMSVAMVSKHVQNLERQLGTRLLHRTSRRVSLNDPGALYYERCSEALNLLEEAETALGLAPETPRGTLRLTAPAWFAHGFFARILHGYRQLCSEVTLDVSLSDGFADLVEDGLDLALRISHEEPAGPHVRALRPIEFSLVRAPGYAGDEVLQFALAPGKSEPGRWRVDNTSLMAQLAVEGAGMATLPRLLLQEYPQLEEVTRLPAATLYAVTQGRRRHAARVRLFLEYLEKCL